MSGRLVGVNLLTELNTLTHIGVVGNLSDAELVDRFLRGRGNAADAAFEVLVSRHGPMVLDVCGSVLRNPHDAQDAFQATFLVLASRAASIRRRDLLASWLLGVARRIALRLRADGARRRKYEREAAETKSDRKEGSPEPWPEVHDEIRRLPTKYREPIVLCYLEGLSTEAAASRLGCPHGTVLSRLSRARERLRRGLTRRGLALPTGLLGAGLSPEAARAAIPAGLLHATVQKSLALTEQPATATALSSTTVVALARGEIRTIMITNMNTLGAAALTCVLAVGGLHGLATHGGGFVGPPQNPDEPRGRPTVTTTVQAVVKDELPEFKNGPGWTWVTRPEALRIGQKWGSAQEQGLMVTGYPIVDADGGALRIFFAQAGANVLESPTYRIVVFDKAGGRHLPKRGQDGGLGSQGIILATTIFTLEPKDLTADKAAYVGVELRTREDP